MSQIVIHPFHPADRLACLAIFDGNAPQYFAPEERVEFARYLDALSSMVPETVAGTAPPYLVLRDARDILACGGLDLDPAGRRAGLTWGMVARGRHGQGLGRRLTAARIAQARALHGLHEITLETSQHTRGFYEGFGFVALRVIPAGFAPGLDRVEMTLSL